MSCIAFNSQVRQGMDSNWSDITTQAAVNSYCQEVSSIAKTTKRNNITEYDDFVTDEDEFESDCETEIEWEEEPESTCSLLSFATTATNEIQHLFNRNRGCEDYCDIFEDRFKSVKSGREMYYADLLAEIGAEKKHDRFKRATTKYSVNSSHTITTPSGKIIHCHLPHHGLLNTNYGLGPFQELFDSVLRDSLIIRDGQNTSTNGIKAVTNDYELRKLPQSFWEEPKGLNDQQTLDFADLLADWASDNSPYDV